jgi:hypothetical protein
LGDDNSRPAQGPQDSANDDGIGIHASGQEIGIDLLPTLVGEDGQNVNGKSEPAVGHG